MLCCQINQEEKDKCILVTIKDWETSDYGVIAQKMQKVIETTMTLLDIFFQTELFSKLFWYSEYCE